MNLKDYPHYFVYLLVIYLFSLAYGMNFLLTAFQYGIMDGIGSILITMLILLPVVFLVMYAVKSRFLLLYKHRSLVRYVAAVSMAISSAFTILLILPLSF